MTSPDVTAYVDLTLFDRSVQDVIDGLVASMQIQFPDWVPIEGHTEVVLLEAVAEEIWRLEQAANRVPPATFEGIVRLLGLVRDPGTGPVMPVRFNAADALGHTIPVGTRLRFTSTDGLTVLDLVTDADAGIAVGATFGVTTATATSPTATLNGGTTGTIIPVDTLPYIDSIVLNGAITSGRDAETSTAYLNRGANRLTRLTSTLVHGDQFATAAEDDPAVVRAHGVDLFNSDAGSGVPGDHPGHVTVLVSGPAGAALSAPEKTALQATLAAEALVNLGVHIANSTITTVAVTADLKRTPTAVAADVITAAQAALTAFLNPDTWPYGRVVYRNDLISLLDQVPGVDVPLTLTAPAADVTPGGVAGLVRAGVLTITTSP
ncbi:MAG: hypothetical protein JWP11_43 [Frankiales bacterium]|nr:hypothetical protein [Frankiales bacterium]